jgi:hypothetical protein
MNISATSKRSFLTLLTAFFAAGALFTVLDLLLALGWLPAFDVNVSGDIERSVTSYVFEVARIVLAFVILIPMMTRKEYGLGVKSKVGLALMILRSFSTPLLDVLYLTLDIKTVIYSLVSTGFFVIYVVGLFMFINGSPVEKKLRRFVKWTPFIPVIISLISVILAGALNNVLQVIDPLYFFHTAATLAIVLVVNKLARQEVESI